MAGVALRVGAARGDLWLDEIWSLELARQAGSLANVLSGLHHDNNHPLNTLWLLLAGEGAPPLVARGLALAASAGMLALAAARPLRGGPPEALATTVLLAASPLLVHHGSEARGYAPALLLVLVAFHALGRFLETRRRGWAGAFAAASVLGLLSHLTFLHALAGFAAWAVLELRRTRRERPAAAADLALLVLPLAALALLWLVDLRHLAIGGGPEVRIPEVLRESLRAALALPRGPLEVLGLAALGAAAAEGLALARAGDPRWAFFAVTAGLAPALVVLAGPAYLAPRYFLVAALAVLLLLGLALGRLARRGAAARLAQVGLLVAFCAASAVPAARLLRDGRGRYRKAIAFLLAGTGEPVATVGSDHEFRNLTVLAYHARHLPLARPLAYVRPGPGVTAPLWFLRHDFSVPPREEPEILVAGRRYALAATFPHAGLSGWTWIVYRRLD